MSNSLVKGNLSNRTFFSLFRISDPRFHGDKFTPAPAFAGVNLCLQKQAAGVLRILAQKQARRRRVPHRVSVGKNCLFFDKKRANQTKHAVSKIDIYIET